MFAETEHLAHNSDVGARFSLYQHQKMGVDFFLNNHVGVLGDEMGLGKTLQAIVAGTCFLQRQQMDEILVVCPRSLKLNWLQEIRKFTSIPASDIVIVEGDRNKRQIQLLTPRKWLIINYESLRIEIEQMLKIFRHRNFIMICDESHKIKNIQAKQSQSCLSIGKLAQRKYLLSGTFIANKPEDVWNQINFLDDGSLLGSYKSFKYRYCVEKTLKYGRRYVNKIVGYKNLDELKEKINTVMLRRTKEQCLDLPARVIQKIPVSMTKKQQIFYRKVCKGIIQDLETQQKNLTLTNILTRMLYALEVASNPALLDPVVQATKIEEKVAQNPANADLRRQLKFWQQIDPVCAEESGKLIALDDLLETYCFEQERKVILWSFFVQNIELFAQRYATKYQPVTYYGKTSSADRDFAVQQFNRNSRCRLFIANPQAAGLGLTLTASSLCIFYDRNFSAVDYQQAIDRIHRIGQTQVCNVFILQAQPSIDQYVDQLLNKKIKLISFLQDQNQEQETVDVAAIEKVLHGQV